MTESNTSGSTRNVIDAFVSAQENKQVTQGGAVQDSATQSGVVQNGATQNVAPRVEPKQNSVAPNGVTQPVVADKKPVQKRKNIWKVLIPVISVAVVGAVVAIVVINLPPSPREISDEEKELREDAKISFSVSDFAYNVEKKMAEDANYTIEDAKKDFEELIAGRTGVEKLRAVVVYAFFIFNQTGDIEKASEIMKSIEGELSGDLLIEYYVSFGDLYRMAQMDEEANRYYDLVPITEDEEVINE
ncbi:hypothetical protein IKT18_03290 [Candidatus Saccharibacteria bacterium]|nr:hypothetical protein [Candidatus Saccharibacteria bacterium]